MQLYRSLQKLTNYCVSPDIMNDADVSYIRVLSKQTCHRKILTPEDMKEERRDFCTPSFLWTSSSALCRNAGAACQIWWGSRRRQSAASQMEPEKTGVSCPTRSRALITPQEKVCVCVLWMCLLSFTVCMLNDPYKWCDCEHVPLC